MRHKNTFLYIIVFLCVLFQSVDYAFATEPPKGYRNFKWGAAPSNKIKKTSSNSDGTSLYIPISKNKPSTLFGYPVAEEAYLFTKGKFYSGIAWIDGYGNYVGIKKLFENNYGEPKFANEDKYIYKWKWINNKIEIHLNYNLAQNRATITFINNGI